jgi:hypothetical protein
MIILGRAERAEARNLNDKARIRRTIRMTTGKYFTLWLPVFKQGDDFDGCLEHSKGDVSKAFSSLSDQYKTAAEICSMVSAAFGKMKDLSDISVEGQVHSISIFAPEEKVAQMVADDLIEVDEMMNEAMEEDEELDDEALLEEVSGTEMVEEEEQKLMETLYHAAADIFTLFTSSSSGSDLTKEASRYLKEERVPLSSIVLKEITNGQQIPTEWHFGSLLWGRSDNMTAEQFLLTQQKENDPDYQLYKQLKARFGE